MFFKWNEGENTDAFTSGLPMKDPRRTTSPPSAAPNPSAKAARGQGDYDSPPADDDIEI